MTTLVIGSSAVGSDGYRGEMLAVVVDPAARTVTHLVVEPHGRAGLARLVPLDLRRPGRCAARPGPAALHRGGIYEPGGRRGDAGRVRAGLPGSGPIASRWLAGAGGPTADGGTILRIDEKETIDVIPPGEVEEHRGDRVHATDGEAGHLRAVRIDPGSGRVTHVLVRHGPAWDRADTAIPAEMVAGFGDGGIRLGITRRQVRDLPPAGLDME